MHRLIATLPRTCLILALGAFALSPESSACTALQYGSGDDAFLAKNHDFMMGEALLLLNTSGRTKTVADSKVPIEWKAKFGSLTYNQFGREYPIGGMNEKGLAVEVLWLDQAQFPAEDARPDIGVLQWVQYQLDTADNVAGVLASDNTLRIFDPHGRVHYFVTDASGDAAVIEWVGGKRLVYRGNSLPVRALANDPYTLSLECMTDGLDREGAVQRKATSHNRFSGVVDSLKHATDASDESFGFKVLERVKQDEYTQFQLVYSPTKKTVLLRRKADTNMLKIDLTEVDFSAKDTLYFDLGTPGALKWEPITRDVNRALIFKSYRATPFLAHLPDDVLESIANTPETFVVR